MLNSISQSWKKNLELLTNLNTQDFPLLIYWCDNETVMCCITYCYKSQNKIRLIYSYSQVPNHQNILRWTELTEAEFRLFDSTILWRRGQNILAVNFIILHRQFFSVHVGMRYSLAVKLLSGESRTTSLLWHLCQYWFRWWHGAIGVTGPQ